MGLDWRAEALAVLDRVIAVVEDAVEPLVQMGHVVATVEIVVHEHFPIAVKRVPAPLHPVQISETELLDLGGQAVAEKRRQRPARPANPDKHPLLPGAHVDWHETVRSAIEVAHSSEIGRACEPALERVGPSVIRAAEDFEPTPEAR